MIISHRHKFVFIKTRKTAGTSIEIMLSGICGPEDIITPISKEDEKERQKLGFRGPQNHRFPLWRHSMKEALVALKKRSRKQYFNHIPAYLIKQYLGPKKWNEYYKFTFDRNPYDKVVSHYFFSKENENINSLNDFIKNKGLDRLKSYEMYTINKKLVVDRIYKYEEMEQSLKHLSDVLGLEKQLSLPEYRAKGHFRKERDSKKMIDPKTKKLIEKRYAREFDLLGYAHY